MDIIDTDYETWAIAYVCGYENDAGGIGTVSALVVLTQEATASSTDAAITAAEASYNANNLGSIVAWKKLHAFPKASKCSTNPTTNAAWKASQQSKKWSSNLISKLFNVYSYVTEMF